MLASDLLTRVRYAVSDIDKKRYTDTRLLILLNDAIRDIAKNTILFIEEKQLVLSNLVVDYDLSSIMTTLVRAEYQDKPIAIKTFEDMDAMDPRWQLKYGTEAAAIVYNKQKNGLIKIYPIVRNAENSHISFNQLNGIVTDITYSDVLPILADSVGDISDIPAIGVIKLYYIRKHAKVTSLTDTLIIDDLIENMLEHYIVGTVLMDNQDAQNVQLGSVKLKLYYQMAEEYTIGKAKGFTRAEYETAYNGGF